MTSLHDPPAHRNSKRTHAAKYPPVALGRLDDRSRWHWLGADESAAADWLDWTITVALVAVCCVPMLLVFCPICWAVRAIIRKAVA